MSKLHRQEVLDIIKGECEFEDDLKLDTNRKDIVDKLNVGATLTAIRHNLGRAETAWYAGTTPHEGSMDYLRKIAALIVQAGQEYGIPERGGLESCKYSKNHISVKDCKLVFCKCKGNY